METTYKSPLALCMKNKHGYNGDMGVIGMLLCSKEKTQRRGHERIKKYGFSDDAIESMKVDLKGIVREQKEIQRKENERLNKIRRVEKSVAHMEEEIPISNLGYHRSVAMTSYAKKSAGMPFEEFYKHILVENSNPGMFIDKKTNAEYQQDTEDNSHWHNTDHDCVAEVLSSVTGYMINEIGVEVTYPEPDNEYAEIVAYMVITGLESCEIEYLTLKFRWMYHNEGHITDFLPGGKHFKEGYDFTCYDGPYPATEEDYKYRQIDKDFEAFKKSWSENGFDEQITFEDFHKLYRLDMKEALTDHYKYKGLIENDDELDVDSEAFYYLCITGFIYNTPEKIQKEINRLLAE